MQNGRRLADGSAISAAYGVPLSTLRTWADRGKLAKHGRDGRGRTLYDVAEVELLVGRSPRSDTGSRLGGCVLTGCVLPAFPGCPVPLCVPHLVAVTVFGRKAMPLQDDAQGSDPAERTTPCTASP